MAHSLQSRQLHLGAFMRPVSLHTGAWRFPGAWPDANFDFAHLKRLAQTLEAARFDAFFMADHLAVLNMPVSALKRGHTATSFEPFTLLSALAAVTSKIGLVATASTTFDAPYHVARRFASLDHKGEHYSVRGPLNIARPPQGWPVIVQAGSSEAGRELAAQTAEAVFTAQPDLETGKRFYADVKGRLARYGRERDHLKILPGAFVVVGETLDEAREKRALLDTFVHAESGIASLSIALGHDVSRFDLDGPLPDIPESNASRSARQRVVDWAREENLTVRQLAQRVGGYSGLEMVGTPESIADEMEQWLVQEGSDGFNVMFPFLPAGVDDFALKVVPELQRRGIFRREYTGKTLRDHLGLPRPANRFFSR
ncbi:NtaA/DmoA family FMN-dependent monooxygenase [Paraburkholderia tropica]|uniref:NtaA/DmoA family FMN-dependent monooxygenase n=1 Tax=Paraburkholderia tropica TaxID=92647 RepID=UPI0031DBE420